MFISTTSIHDMIKNILVFNIFNIPKNLFTLLNLKFQQPHTSFSKSRNTIQIIGFTGFPPTQQYPSGDIALYPPIAPPSDASNQGGPGWVMPQPGANPYSAINTPSAPTKADLAAGYNPPGNSSGMYNRVNKGLRATTGRIEIFNLVQVKE